MELQSSTWHSVLETATSNENRHIWIYFSRYVKSISAAGLEEMIKSPEKTIKQRVVGHGTKDLIVIKGLHRGWLQTSCQWQLDQE